ncbi:MAG: hypothetical protein GY865_11720, partial [candidate division Zixibacteria bacterium]|nr:hypothetical protein [candidate division Zixibacteria bacterium]
IEEITDKPKYVIKAGVTVEEIGRAMCSHFGTKFSEAGRENDEKALLKAGLLEEKRQHKFNHELAKMHYDRRLTEGTLPVSKPELKVDNCLMCNFTLNARSGGVCFHPDKKINGPCPKGVK